MQEAADRAAVCQLHARYQFQGLHSRRLGTASLCTEQERSLREVTPFLARPPWQLTGPGWESRYHIQEMISYPKEEGLGLFVTKKSWKLTGVEGPLHTYLPILPRPCPLQGAPAAKHSFSDEKTKVQNQEELGPRPGLGFRSFHRATCATPPAVLSLPQL